MFRCGHCPVISENYEDWLSHIISDEHQGRLGVSEIFLNHNKDLDRNERSIVVKGLNPKTHPYEVLTYFATEVPLSFITDVHIHLFPHVNEKFYLIVFDQKKFAERLCTSYDYGKQGDHKVASSLVNCKSKSALTVEEWDAKIKGSFFNRRHEHLKVVLNEMSWDEQLAKFVKIVSLCEKGYQTREKIMEELEELIHEKYSEAQVNAFGSCSNWLADVNADLDVYVDALGNGGRNDLSYDQKQDIMKDLTKIFREKYDGWNVFAIRNARVPIIVLNHPSGIKVDVSFENCLSVQNSKMIRLMTKLDPRIRPFLTVLRYWARYHNLIGPNSVKSYALTLMAFTHLRKKKILPSVHELQNIEGLRSFMVCGWNATFCANRDIVLKHMPWLKTRRDMTSDGMGHEIMRMCYEFFTEFSEFDFDSRVICPLLGESLPKSNFDSLNGVELPNEMGLLKANLVTGHCTGFATEKPLCIQDPFVLNVNVTASCQNVDNIYTFKAACVVAAQALKPFISVYGSADKERILDLVCKIIPEIIREEVIMKSNNIPFSDQKQDNLDNVDYIKTEATTTTNEDENWDLDEVSKSHVSNNSPTSTSTTNDSDSHREKVSDSLRSIKEFYKDAYSCDILQNTGSRKDRRTRTRESSREGTGNKDRDRASFSNRSSERDRGQPTRIQRISIYNEDKELEPRVQQTVKMEVDEDENILKKALKSIIVVAKKKKDLKSKPTRETQSTGVVSSSSSSTSSEGESQNRKSIKEKETEVRSKKEKKWFGSESSAKESSADEGISNKSEDKSMQKIVVLVENKAPVEPVVTFLSSDAPPPSAPASVSHPQLDETGAKVSVEKCPETSSQSSNPTKHLEFSSPECSSPSPSWSETNQVVKFVHNLSLTSQIAPPETTLFDFNYGYSLPPANPLMHFQTSIPQLKTVEPPSQMLPKPKTKTMQPYVPPNKRVEGDSTREDSPVVPSPASATAPIQPQKPIGRSGPILLFPSFGVFLSDDYYQSFLQTLQPLAIPEKTLLSKMKVLWINAVSDLFLLSHIWSKFSPIFVKESLTDRKLEDLVTVFTEVDRERVILLQEAKYPPYIPNRKRPSTMNETETESSDGSSDGPSIKLRKVEIGTEVFSNTPNLSEEINYKVKVTLMEKLAKLPCNVRKKYAYVYYFQCHPGMMKMLKTHWDRLLQQIQLTSIAPLDLLGKICEQIRVHQETTPPTSEWIQVKLLVAFDTTAETPGVHFGFQHDSEMELEDDARMETCSILKNIFADLITAQCDYRRFKYFEQPLQKLVAGPP